MKSTDLFFRNDRLIRPFFARPFTTAIIFFCFGSIITLLAWGLHLGGVVSDNGCNVGFFYRPNWAFMYLILLPAVFYLMSSILTESTLAVKALSSPEIRIIEPVQPTNDQSFEDSLYLLMREWKMRIYPIAVAAALVPTVLTIYLLLTNPSATGDDWAERMPLFAVFVFVVQGAYIFLGIFWVLIFAAFIASFIRLTLRQPAGFRLNLMLYDPEGRMGLGVIGGLLNQFALAALLFESYVAVYGLQAAADVHRTCLVQYVQATFKPKALLPPFSLADFSNSFNFSSAGVLAWAVLSVLLWIVYIAIPMFYLRPRLDQMRKDAWRQHAREFECANRENNESRVKPLEREFEALRTSSSWPNGSTLGIGLMVALFAMPLIPSPFGPYLVTSGVLMVIYKVLKSMA
jgi:hypothetical protein